MLRAALPLLMSAVALVWPMRVVGAAERAADAGPEADAGLVADAGLAAPTGTRPGVGTAAEDPAKAIEVAPDAGAVETSEVPLRFRNNKVLAEEVYRSILDLPKGSKVERATAYAVRTQIEAFLRKCGYELATVSTAIVDDAKPAYIDVDINEGLLEKVVFRGKFTFKTLRFKLALQLPYDVFNRPELERQIRALTVELNLGRVWYELVPTREVKHIAPQVESLGQLGEIQGYELVHPREPYELHIFFEEKAWDTGAWLDLRTSNIDGLEAIGVDQGQGLLANDDRYRLSISGGAGLRNPILLEGSAPRLLLIPELYPTFSRAYGEAIYYASLPRIRPLVEARSELVSRQRKDLNIENYFNLDADALLSVEYEFARKQTITLGAGERYQRVFGLQAGPNDDDQPLPAPGEHDLAPFRTFAELRADILFADGNERWDRRDELTLEARHFFTVNAPLFGEARAAWQRVFSFGWDDLWIKAHAAYLYGDVPFTYQEPVNGVHLRNVFGNVYVDHVASESTEFRFSLTRDLIKVSLFNDVAVFGYDNPTEVLSWGDAFGPGLHFLIQGMFQLDMYYAIGLANVAPIAGATVPHLGLAFDNGFSLSLQKVF